MSALAKVLPAVSGTILARVSVLAIGFATSVITARALGPDGRGRYFAVVTLAGIVAQFGNLGLSSSNTYLAAREPSLSWGLVANGLWVCLATGLVTAAVLAAFSVEWSTRLGVTPGILWAVCLLGPAILGFTFASSVLVANLRFRALNWWQVTNASIAMIALGACALLGAGVGTFVIATTFAAVVAAIGASASVAGTGQRIAGFNIPLFRRGIGFALRAYLALLFGYLLQRVAVGFLAACARPGDIGIFSVASQIYDVLIIVPTTIGLVLFPTLIKQQDGRRETTLQILGVTMVLMVGACMVLAWVGDWLIPRVFGRDFSPSFTVLLCLLPGAMLISIITVLSQYLVAGGFPSTLVLLWAAGLAICMATSAPLISRYGAAGAAAAQSIGIAVVGAGVIAMFNTSPWRHRDSGTGN